MKKYTGYEADGNLTYCVMKPDQSSSSLVEACPFFSLDEKKWSQKELIVLIHNQGMYNQSLARVKLPSQFWKARIWSKRDGVFEDVDTDIVEQIHLDAEDDSKQRAKVSSDYEMFIPLEDRDTMAPGEVMFVKIEKLNGDKQNSNPRYKQFASKTSLTV